MLTVDGAHRNTAIPAAVVAHLLCDQRVVIQTPPFGGLSGCHAAVGKET